MGILKDDSSVGSDEPTGLKHPDPVGHLHFRAEEIQGQIS